MTGLSRSCGSGAHLLCGDERQIPMAGGGVDWLLDLPRNGLCVCSSDSRLRTLGLVHVVHTLPATSAEWHVRLDLDHLKAALPGLDGLLDGAGGGDREAAGSHIHLDVSREVHHHFGRAAQVREPRAGHQRDSEAVRRGNHRQLLINRLLTHAVTRPLHATTSSQ